jgi:hypothetical protein
MRSRRASEISISRSRPAISRVVFTIGRSCASPSLERTSRSSTRAASTATLVTRSPRNGNTRKPTIGVPLTEWRCSASACIAHVRAPVSALALMAPMPKAGRATHSRHPTRMGPSCGPLAGSLGPSGCSGSRRTEPEHDADPRPDGRSPTIRIRRLATRCSGPPGSRREGPCASVRCAS